jgi:hypothetical protein
METQAKRETGIGNNDNKGRLKIGKMKGEKKKKKKASAEIVYSNIASISFW